MISSLITGMINEYIIFFFIFSFVYIFPIKYRGISETRGTVSYLQSNSIFYLAFWFRRLLDSPIKHLFVLKILILAPAPSSCNILFSQQSHTL